MPDIHLKWGGSTATRTMNCAAWPNVAAKAPDIDRTSAAAERGTMLHNIMEQYYENADADLGELCKDLTPDDREAIDYAINIVEALLDEHNIDDFMCEKMLKIPEYEIGGSADMIAWSDDVIIIIDYKFGYMPVTDVDQFLLYAIAGMATPGIKEQFHGKRILSAVVQPAVNPAAALVHEHTQQELQAFHIEFLRQVKISETTMTTAGNPGPWCKYCPGAAYAAYCDAKRGQVGDFLSYDPKVATELASGMALIAQMKEHIKAIEGEAFTALEHGIPVPGWKLVMKRKTRYWKDPAAAWRKLRYSKASKPLYVEESLRSPAQVEKELKKAKIEVKGFDLLIDNKSSGTTIAPESDKRDAVTVGVVPAALDAILQG